MKFVLITGLIFSLGFSVMANAAYAPKSETDIRLINIIEGTVYGPNRRPIPDLWIELQNEFNLNMARVRTTGSGRFTFSGMGSGRYYIRVYTTGTDFEEQTVAVEVVNVVANSSDAVYQDINLKLAKNKADSLAAQVTKAVFVQDVPAEAKNYYRTGVRELNNQQFEKGEAALKEAIKIFPDYYDALDALGCNYVDNKLYAKSLPYLIHSIDVNQRSFSSFYSLGYAAYKLGQLAEASEAARAATILQPGSVNAQLLYGTVLRMRGDNPLALETLLKAEKLNKSTPIGEIHWQLAMLYDKLKRNKDAADELEIYLKVQPEVKNKKEIQDWIQRLRNTKV